MLFKFQGPTAHSLKNIRDGTLFCRHFSQFNDPFEFRAAIIGGVPMRETDPGRFAVAATAWGFPDGVPEDLEESAEEYFSSLEYGEPPFKKMLDSTRVTCFGTDGADLLMWSHYADGLRGFCIFFDEQALLGAEPAGYLAPVEYLDTPPTVDSFLYAVADDQLSFHLTAIDEGDRLEKVTGVKDSFSDASERASAEAIATMHSIWRLVFAAKPLEWKYEREKRLLFMIEDGGAGPLHSAYPPAAIKEVIIGERMISSYREELLAVVSRRYGRVPVSLAVRTEGSYQLQVVPLNCP